MHIYVPLYSILRTYVGLVWVLMEQQPASLKLRCDGSSM